MKNRSAILPLLILQCLLMSIPSEGQSPTRMHLPETYPLTPSLKDLVHPEGTDITKEEYLLEPGFSLMRDSIYETRNLGYKTIFYKWYYTYNASYRVDSVYRYFFTEYGEKENVWETRKYDAEGRLRRLARLQPDPWNMSLYGDSSIVEYYLEEYTWENGHLVHESNTQIDWGSAYTTEIYHFYDDEGKLVRDSTIWGGSSPSLTYYHYNSDDELEYITRGNSYIQKYEYEQTDTSRLTTHKIVVYQYDILRDWDTIRYWLNIRYFYETFDEAQRRASLTVSDTNIWSGTMEFDYRAEYRYTDWGELLSARYYDWQGTLADGEWKEATRIDLVYNEDRKVEHYENWFYDARTEEWVMELEKEYFYSPISNELSLKAEQTSLLTVFPNPGRDIITLRTPSDLQGSYTIYTLNGIPVQHDRLEGSVIDIAPLAPGLYMITVVNSRHTFTSRFIKY